MAPNALSMGPSGRPRPLDLRIASPGQVDRRRFAAVEAEPPSPMPWKFTADDHAADAAALRPTKIGLRGRWAAGTTPFRDVDLNGDGTIDSSELAHALRSMGVDATDSAARAVIRRGDEDHNGGLDEEEFLALMQSRLDLDKPFHDAVKPRRPPRGADERKHQPPHMVVRPSSLGKKGMQRSPSMKGQPQSPTKAAETAARGVARGLERSA